MSISTTFLTKGFVALVLFLAQATWSQSAEIVLQGNVITLKGNIDTGDAAKLFDLVDKAQTAAVSGLMLNLSSDGGSFSEGMKMSRFIAKSHLTTIVKSGNRCNSACALVFLAGSIIAEEDSEEPDRRLEPGAELGFHAPFVNETVGEKSVNVPQLTRAMTEEINRLTEHLRILKVPDAMRPLLLKNDAQHSLYDATTMEAIELLDITVVAESESLQHITRSMAQNACLNGYRLAREELPSGRRKSDLIAFSDLSAKYGVLMPLRQGRDFALITAVRQPTGDPAVCKIDMGGVCQNFYELSILQKPDDDGDDIAEMNACARQNANTTLVPPDTRLASLAGTLRNMQMQEPMFLRALDELTQENHDGRDVPDPPSQQDFSEGVICNLRANGIFANVRRGPSGKDALVVALPNHTKVQVIGEARNPASNHIWKRISFDGGEGYVDNELVASACLLALRQPEQIQPQTKLDTNSPETPSEPSADLRRKVTVCNQKGDSVNVRSYPDPEANNIIAKRFNHETLTVIGETNNPKTGHLYFKVETGGAVGYVFNEYVSFSCSLPNAYSAPTPQAQSNGIKYFSEAVDAVICNANYHSTNIRAEPIPTRANVIFSLSNRTPVLVLGEARNPVSGSPWYFVKTSGGEGFVSSDSVAIECVSRNQQQSVGYVICNSKSDVSNLRSGPSAKLFDIIKVLKNQTPVDVLETTRNPESGHVWLKIKSNGVVGFVDSDWVKQGC